MAPPPSGDWYCPGCRDLQFARNPVCRRCGTAKPPESGASSTALALVAPRPPGPTNPLFAPQALPGDWVCYRCQDVNFGTRSSCRKCGSAKPEGGNKAVHDAITLQNSLPGSAATGAIVGYITPGTVQPVSSWARQWESGPANGMLVGEFDLPNWMQAQSPPANDGAKDSDSGDEKPAKKLKRKRKEAEKDGSRSASGAGSAGAKDAARKKKAKKKKKVKANKQDPKEGEAQAGVGAEDAASSNAGSGGEGAKGATGQAKAKAKVPKRKKDIDVEEELALRRKQRERRQNRIIALD